MNYLQKIKEDRAKCAQVDYLVQKLIFCLIDNKTPLASDLLADDGVFLGSSKLRFLGKINTVLSPLKVGEYTLAVHDGISLGSLPGARVIEVRFLNDAKVLTEQAIQFPPLGTPPRENEIVLSFAIYIEGEHIKKITRPKSVIATEAFFIEGTEMSKS